MSTVSVYGWIRESVKRAVLLGFSDAVEAIGAPEGNNEELHPHLQALIKDKQPLLASAAANSSPSSRTTGTSKRKRLGRSLEQIQKDRNEARS